MSRKKVRICEYCGSEFIITNDFKSRRFCSRHCMINHKIQKCKETKLDRYGDSVYVNPDKAQKTKLDKYGNSNYVNPDKAKETKLNRYGDKNYHNIEKMKETNIKKYGVLYTQQVKDIRQKGLDKKLEKYGDKNYNNRDKYQTTCVERYGTKSYTNREKAAQTCYKNYGVYTPAKSSIVQSSIYNTKKQNNSFNQSKPEEEIYNKLIEKFGESNIERQYRSKEYPFNCDFYIKSLDLYIEYQGLWTHGGTPYNKNNKNHQKIVKIWENRSKEVNCNGKQKLMYVDAVKTWTKRDPKKRKIAKDNNLNWVEFFNLDQFNQWYNKIL